MPFSSQAGRITVRTQTAQGTYATDLATAGTTVKMTNGGLATNRSLMITDPEIGGGRDVNDAVLGPVSWSGEYTMYPRMESITTFLKAALGASASVTTTGVTAHTITPVDVPTLPFLSIEEAVGGISGGFDVYQYTDAVVNTFHLECSADGFLTCTVGLVAIKQTAGNTAATTPPTDNSPVVVGTNTSIQFNGVTLPAKSFSMDINNNFDEADWRLGSFYLGSLIAKRREITFGASIRSSDSALWRQAVYGASAATSPGGVTTKQPVVISVATYDNIIGGTPATPAGMTINVPLATIKPYSIDPNQDDIIENAIEIEALRPNIATPIATIVVKSAKATIS